MLSYAIKTSNLLYIPDKSPQFKDKKKNVLLLGCPQVTEVYSGYIISMIHTSGTLQDKGLLHSQI